MSLLHEVFANSSRRTRSMAIEQWPVIQFGDEIVKQRVNAYEIPERLARRSRIGRGQGFSGRGRAQHGNKTRRTLISDSENREHEPCHDTQSFFLSFSMGSTGAHNTACRIQLEPVAMGCTDDEGGGTKGRGAGRRKPSETFGPA